MIASEFFFTYYRDQDVKELKKGAGKKQKTLHPIQTKTAVNIGIFVHFFTNFICYENTNYKPRYCP